MKRYIILLLSAIACMSISMPTTAVAAGQLSLKDITSGMFRAETMPSVTALSDGESYAYISADGKQVVKCSFKTGKQTGTMIDLNTTRGPKLDQIDGFIVSPDGQRMLIQTDTKYIYRRSFTAVYYIYSLRNNTLEPLSQGGPQQTPLFSPNGQQIAFVRDNNIWLVKLLYDNAESQVTKDGEKNKIINGIPDWVCEEEFSTNRSMVFSADSRQIVWVRYDETDVNEYSMQLFKGSHPSRKEYAKYPGLYSYKYPVPGTQNARVKVMSYDIKSHRTREMQLPIDADGYVARLAMTSDSSKVAVFTLNRHQDQLRIYMANPLSTLCQMVVEDRVKHYIKEETFHCLHFTDRHMLLTSERTGMNGLYLYTLTGQLVRKVVADGYVVKDAYGYDESTGDIYFAANPTGPTEQQVMVSHKNGKTDVLTPQKGCSSAIFSSNLRYFICEWSDINHPVTYTLHDNKGKQTASLVDNQALSDKLKACQLGTKELFSFTTSEGVLLNGWIVKPADFNSQKRYPVIMYQYGGPGNQQVLNRWSIGMSGQGAILEQWLCQQGYVCVCVDGRGRLGRCVVESIVQPGNALYQPFLDVVDLGLVTVGDIIIGPNIHPPAGPCLGIACLGTAAGHLVSQRVDGRPQAIITQVGLAHLGPASPALQHIIVVRNQPLPPEGDHRVARGMEIGIHARHPIAGKITLVVATVTEGKVEVPDDHLETRVNTVPVFIELGTQPIGIHIVAKLADDLIVHERLHVDILAVTLLGILEVVGGKRILHSVNRSVDVVDLIPSHVLIVRRLVLEEDIAILIGNRAVGIGGMMLGDVGHLVIGSHLHEVAARQLVARFARVAQIEAVNPLGHHFTEDIHTIVDAIEIDFTQPPLGSVFHPRPCRLKGEQVADHALVGIRSQQCPVVVLAHAQDRYLLLVITLIKGLAQRPERVRFLVTAAVGRVAPIADGDVALIVDVLPGMSNRVTVVELPLAVVNDLHAPPDALVAVYCCAVHIYPHDGQVGRVDDYRLVVRWKIIR